METTEREFIKTFCQTSNFRTEKANDNIINNVIVYNFKDASGYEVKFDENNKPISPIKSEKNPTLEMKRIYDKAYRVWKKEMTKKIFG